MYKYVHGGDIYSLKETIKNVIDFSANINPLGMPNSVKTAIIEAIEDCDKYPDPFSRELVEGISRYEDVEKNHIFCSNGASEIIFRLALAIKPKRVLLFAPTFADYEKAFKTIDAEIVNYYLKEENNFYPQKDFLDFIDESIDVVIIVNPNNPTGQLCEKDFMKDILTKCKNTNTKVIVDECFIDFIDNTGYYSVKSYINDFNHLVILKAFTKIFAIPGVRLGYVLTTNIELLDKIRDAGQDWSVSVIAQRVGISILHEAEYIEKTKKIVQQQREKLITEFTKLGFEVFGSMANYIFFKASNIKNLREIMLEESILIRDCSNYKGLSKGYYRVCVHSEKNNEKLIEILKDKMVDRSWQK